MPCSAKASARIHASVRPAIGMPLNASRTPSTSSKARDMARRPAPPVSTSVPSISKRMRAAREAPLSVASAFAANVAGTRPFGRRFFFELDALAFIQLIEAALDRAPGKKPLLAAVVANEPESSVTHESLDGATRHPGLLGRPRVRAPRVRISSFVPCRISMKCATYTAECGPEPRQKRKRNTPVYECEGTRTAVPHPLAAAT